MALYVISFDLRKERNYDPLLNQLRDWGCSRLLESVWVGELRGPAGTIAKVLTTLSDADAGLAVLPLAESSDWAILGVQQAGLDWLKRHHP